MPKKSSLAGAEEAAGRPVVQADASEMSESSSISKLRLAFSNISRNLPVPWNPITQLQQSDRSESEHNVVGPSHESFKVAVHDFEKSEKFLDYVEDLASQWLSAENELRSLGESLSRCLDEAVAHVQQPSLKYGTRLISSSLEAVNDVNQQGSECVTAFLLGISKVSSERRIIAERRAQISELESTLAKMQAGRNRKPTDPHTDIQSQKDRLYAEQASLIGILKQAERNLENHIARELAILVDRELDALRNAAEVFARLQEPLFQAQRSLPAASLLESQRIDGHSATETKESISTEILQLLSATDFSFAMVLAEVGTLSARAPPPRYRLDTDVCIVHSRHA
jgi:hypothetical protein